MDKPHDDLVFCAGMICWWGKKLARSRPNTLVMERALTNVQMSRAHSSTPDRPQRPRYGQRVFSNGENEPSAVDWDDIKRGRADGSIPPPERSPWVD